MTIIKITRIVIIIIVIELDQRKVNNYMSKSQ